MTAPRAAWRSTLASLRCALACALAGAAALGLVACTVVTSESLNDVTRASQEPVGVYYALPMGLVDFTLYVNPQSAEYRIEIGDPRYVADPRQRYMMRYQPLANYSDAVEIAVNERQLIQKVHTTTEDQTGKIIVELASAFARASPGSFQAAAPGAGFIKIATVTIDPTEPGALRAAARDLSARARTFAATFSASKCVAEFANELECRLFARYRQPGSELVTLRAEAPAVEAAHLPADCTVGLCYRISEPWLLVASVAGVRSAKIVSLPNKAPLVEIEVRRALFVEKVHEIEFDKNGFLKTARIKKPSELLAVAQTPISVIAAIGKAFPLRLEIQQKQNDLAEKQLAEIEARRNLLEAREQSRGAAGNTNFK